MKHLSKAVPTVPGAEETKERRVNKITGDSSRRRVRVDGKYLSPSRSLKVRSHSPKGFSWGDGGDGSAQLALALLLTVTDKNTALKLYHEFKWEVIAKIDAGDFTVIIDLQDWVQQHMIKRELLISRYGTGSNGRTR